MTRPIPDGDAPDASPSAGRVGPDHGSGSTQFGITLPRDARTRGDAAAGRLHAARSGFDRSIAALCKAALDHVDRQDLASTALRANLDRLVRRLGADA